MDSEPAFTTKSFLRLSSPFHIPYVTYTTPSLCNIHVHRAFSNHLMLVLEQTTWNHTGCLPRLKQGDSVYACVIFASTRQTDRQASSYSVFLASRMAWRKLNRITQQLPAQKHMHTSDAFRILSRAGLFSLSKVLVAWAVISPEVGKYQLEQPCTACSSSVNRASLVMSLAVCAASVAWGLRGIRNTTCVLLPASQ